MRFVLAILILRITTLPDVVPQSGCSSFPATVMSGPVTIPVPVGFVEACSAGHPFCDGAKRGYPPSVQTWGYFVPETEWSDAKAGKRDDFSNYLIAQVLRNPDVGELLHLKEFLHSQGGAIKDHSRIAGLVETLGRVNLGIQDETESTITIGTVMKNRTLGNSPKEVTHVALNLAASWKSYMFSLYVFRDFKSPNDIERAKQTSKAWVSCLARG